MKKNRPEILAPCGNMSSLRAAVAAGADACYLAGNSFGARAYADNFNENELLQAIDLAHLHDIKIYLTANTLVKNNEMEMLLESLIPLYKEGLDGVLVQDFGVLKMIREHFPELPVHTSTQMNITTPEGAMLAKKMGAVRVVAAREMTIEELARIKQNVDIELEAFVHGAMCFCYSGRCYMSSFAGGRSGNRGRCAQPCRKKYIFDNNDSYFMSMRDMCSLRSVPALIDTGVDSLKIEGRMKNEYYVAATVDAYRAVSDAYIHGDFSMAMAERYEKRLLDTFNRGGFTSGYLNMKRDDMKRHDILVDDSMPGRRGVYIGKVSKIKDGGIGFKAETELFPGDDLLIDIQPPVNISVPSDYSLNNKSNSSDVFLKAPQTKRIPKGAAIYRNRCPKLIEQLDEMINSGGKIDLSARIKVKCGEPLEFKLWTTDAKNSFQKDSVDSKGNLSVQERKSVTVYGNTVLEAEKNPVSEDVIKDKITALGGTIYRINNLEIINDNKSFVPASVLKKLRRDAIEELENKIISGYYRKMESAKQIIYDNHLKDSYFSTEKNIDSDDKNIIHVSVADPYQLGAVLKSKMRIDYIYLDISLEAFDEAALLSSIDDIRNKTTSKIILSLPYINRGYDIVDYFSSTIGLFDGFYIRCFDDMAQIISDKNGIFDDKLIILSSSLYCYNDSAVAELMEIFANIRMHGSEILFDIPLELSIFEAEKLGYISASVIDVYTKIPLMLTDALGDYNGSIQDDRKNRFDMRYAWGYNVILGNKPLMLFSEAEEVLNNENSFGTFADFKNIRLSFSTETVREVEDILSGGKELLKKNNYTKGHYEKGIL